ncbi:uncharacterized protein JCM6883_001458 [Sporobolomyces salmoneus]|uniref:uncharacterized protein n=1 Tax=Sporobolomyces salmoneus TaxID=183962 RepID=UPI003176A585
MSKSSKQDLLVRVRYQNPLPSPPFPPRLLHVPTTPARYASYDFLNPLQSERELPMILDGELGLPLEYGKSRSGNDKVETEYWLGNREVIAPRNAVSQPLADEDAFLLEEPSTRAGGSNGATGSASATVGSGAAAAATESKKVDVSWLRRTEYLANETAVGGNKPSQLTPKRQALAPIGPQDRDSRARAIANTFETAHMPLSELRHPTKQHLTATEAFDFLPDSELWAHEYDFVRFGEDPIDQSNMNLNRTGADPRVPRAVFRDLTSEFAPGQERLSYYLPQDDTAANKYTGKRFEGGVSGEETFDFRWIRDYEIANQRALEHEFVVSFDSGTIEEDGATEAEVQAKPDAVKKRKKGAYYLPVGQTSLLRKRRPKRGENPKHFPEGVEEQFWDGISVSLVPKEAVFEEKQLRLWEQYKAEVDQPPNQD